MAGPPLHGARAAGGGIEEAAAMELVGETAAAGRGKGVRNGEGEGMGSVAPRTWAGVSLKPSGCDSGDACPASGAPCIGAWPSKGEGVGCEPGVRPCVPP